MSSSFCEWSKTDDGVVHLTLTGVDHQHNLSKEALCELRDKLGEIRRHAASEPCRGLITTSSGGAFCSGIDYDLLRSSFDPPMAEQTRILSDGMAAVISELMAMPMPTVCAATGDAINLGLALALAHDDLVVLGDARCMLGMVEQGVAVYPCVAALIREKTDRWNTITTMESRRKTGSWMKSWNYADAERGSREGVLREAERMLEEEWAGADGEVLAGLRKQLFRETWVAVSEAN